MTGLKVSKIIKYCFVVGALMSYYNFLEAKKILFLFFFTLIGYFFALLDF